MTSANPKVQEIHDAYCAAMSLHLPNNAAFERWWLSALCAGLSTDDIKQVIKSRQAAVKDGTRYPPCLLLRNLIATDEAIGDTLNEAAVLKGQAARRAHVQSDKTQVLAATGRTHVQSTQATQLPLPKLAGQLAADSLARLRKAAGMPPAAPDSTPPTP